jgi:hypothetical protein
LTCEAPQEQAVSLPTRSPRLHRWARRGPEACDSVPARGVADLTQGPRRALAGAGARTLDGPAEQTGRGAIAVPEAPVASDSK